MSKAISRLEAQLGLRLLDRSSRRVALTDEGDSVPALYREAVARALAARDLAQARRSRPQGILRVSAPVALGRLILVPALPRLAERYPELAVHLNLTDRFVTFSEDRVDVALRLGRRTGPPGAGIRRLGSTHWVTVASPAYLARRGHPRVPADLARHECLRFLTPDGRAKAWTFVERRGRRPLVVGPTGRLLSDDGEALVDAAIAGLGIVQAIDFMVTAPLGDGRLLEVLRDHAAEGPAIYLLTAPGHGDAPRVRAFAEFASGLFHP